MQDFIKSAALPTKKQVRGGYHKESYDAVLDALRRRPEAAMSAEEVALALREGGVSIGLTTVYRRLSRLCEEGLSQKLFSDGKTALYRYAGDCRGDHYHLVCTSCGKVTHLSCDLFSELYRHVGDSHGFHVDGSRTHFYGVCGACYRAKKQISATENTN